MTGATAEDRLQHALDLAYRYLGRRDRIARRLQAAGVGEDEVAAALGGRDPYAERDAAVALLRRRLRAAPDSDRERERALGILVRKGYELDLAYEAVRAFER